MAFLKKYGFLVGLGIFVLCLMMIAGGKNKVYKYTKCSICEKEKNCYEVLVAGNTMYGDFEVQTSYICSDICQKVAEARCKRIGAHIEIVYK